MRAHNLEHSETFREGRFVRSERRTIAGPSEQLSIKIPRGDVRIFAANSPDLTVVTSRLIVSAESEADGRRKLDWKKGELVVRQTEDGKIEVDGKEEEGIGGRSYIEISGSGRSSGNWADSFSAELGPRDSVKLNGVEVDVPKGGEIVLDAPYIRRSVTVNIPAGVAVNTEVEVRRGAVELVGLKGKTNVKTTTADVDATDLEGTMKIDTYGSPITVVNFTGDLEVRGSFIGRQYPSVAIDGFEGTADIRLGRSGKGAILLREGTEIDLDSVSREKVTVVPHGEPLRRSNDREDVSRNQRTIKLMRGAAYRGTSSLSYA